MTKMLTQGKRLMTCCIRMLIIQSNLGIESTPEEKQEAHGAWMKLASKIRDLDSKFYAERIQAQHQ
jgi:hypothetical protein